MSILTVLPLAAETGAETGAGATPYIVAGVVLLLLLGGLVVLLAIGKGREHS